MVRWVLFAVVATACGHDSTPTAGPQVKTPGSNEVAAEPPPIAPIRSPVCLPVARCASFTASPPRCELLAFDPDGRRTDANSALEPKRVYPGFAGVDPSVREAFDYLESERSCGQLPLVLAPAHRCRLDAGTCTLVP